MSDTTSLSFDTSDASGDIGGLDSSSSGLASLSTQSAWDTAASDAGLNLGDSANASDDDGAYNGGWGGLGGSDSLGWSSINAGNTPNLTDAAIPVDNKISGTNSINPVGGVQLAATGDKTFGLPRPFWNWYHRQMKVPGDADLDRGGAIDLYKMWLELGKPGPENG